MSLGTWNTARPLSDSRPRYRSTRVRTRSYFEIRREDPAQKERAAANRRPAAAVSNCSQGEDERNANAEPYYASSIYVTPKAW